VPHHQEIKPDPGAAEVSSGTCQAGLLFCPGVLEPQSSYKGLCQLEYECSWTEVTWKPQRNGKVVSSSLMGQCLLRNPV